jgi:ATP-binding cassette, subfamily B, bacterial
MRCTRVVSRMLESRLPATELFRSSRSLTRRSTKIMNTLVSFQRAPGTPPLPATPARFIGHFIAQFPVRYGAMVVLEGSTAACGILLPYVLGKIIRSVTQAHDNAATVVANLHRPLAWFVALDVAEVVLGRLAGGVQVRLGPRQRQNVTRQIHQYLQNHCHHYFSNNFAGALAHRISETSMGVTQTLWSIITEFWPVTITITIGVSVGLLFNAHAVLGSFALAWAVLFVGISFILARRCQPRNIASARLFARLGFERENLERTLERELKAVRRSNGYSERVRWFQFSAAAALKIGVLYYALALWQKGAIGVGDFVMAVSLSLMIINEARNLSRRFLEFFEYIGNVANGVHTIVRAHEVIDAPDAEPVPITRGSIEFREVDFGYSNERRVFNRLSVTIPAGQSVGLVGLSGSGKSTFVSLVLRLFDPQHGQVLIDGTDIRRMTQDSLHAQLSLIPQDPSLFHRTLLENIRYGRLEASDEEVIEAARKASAHEFIEQIKDGYRSMVGERGIKLSGGQRQRIAIARVILKNAPVLILDEATSSLDSITERAIQTTLDQVMKGKTVIVVAHRLSIVAHLDRILVFDQGRIVEDGSHAALLAQRGAYYRLWSRQAGGFLPELPEGPNLERKLAS